MRPPVRSAVLADVRRARVCSILRGYPLPAGEALSFESGDISPLCKPFVRGTRATLDRCGDTSSDPYSKARAGGSKSGYTWPNRKQMYSKGKVNLLADLDQKDQLPLLYKRIEQIRESATSTCCGGDMRCRNAMNSVEVSLCKPNDDPDASDPCVFGGTYEMAGRNYETIFGTLYRQYSTDDHTDLRAIAERNLSAGELGRSVASPATPLSPIGGRIVLTSYVPRNAGFKALEPTLHHEFGHACSMIRMQSEAANGQDPVTRPRAMRALAWLDRVKKRCDQEIELPEAYFDFWESVGESRELASCLFKLTEMNRKQQIDKPCNGLCPGHYLEESVGVAFAMLNGDLSGLAESVYPNTCDHMRDSQHPMVSDVVECLAQHSPRFRERLNSAYACGTGFASR